MSKFVITATYTLALAVAVACNASTEPATTGESSSEPNIIQPETPAPVQESGKSLSYNFDSDAAGSMPAKFHDALTGKGSRGQWVVKEVKDTGVGIPAEALPHIFERFYRVDKARSRAVGGTGLGLAIVKSISMAHGGQVKVESTENKGSRFQVQLPAPSAASRLAQAQTNSPQIGYANAARESAHAATTKNTKQCAAVTGEEL